MAVNKTELSLDEAEKIVGGVCVFYEKALYLIDEEGKVIRKVMGITSDIVYSEDDYEKKFGRKFDPEDKSARKF